MVGQFLPSREFVVDILVSNDEGEQVPLSAVVDTGFSGYLTLPLSVIRRLNLPQTDTEEASLADGRVIRFGVYQATAAWDEEERTVAALGADGDALIGISPMMESIGTFEFQVADFDGIQRSVREAGAEPLCGREMIRPNLVLPAGNVYDLILTEISGLDLVAQAPLVQCLSFICNLVQRKRRFS